MMTEPGYPFWDLRQARGRIQMRILVVEDEESLANQVAEALRQESYAVDMAHDGEEDFSDKIQLPCFYWNRCIIVPQNHPLTKLESVSFDILAQYPLLTHTSAGGKTNRVETLFKENGFSPEIVFSATDCEIIKSYVRMGLGVGIIASMAYEEHLDADLVSLPISHLIPKSLVNVVFDRNLYFREYKFSFIEALAPQLSKELILQAQQTKSANKINKMVEQSLIPIL